MVFKLSKQEIETKKQLVESLSLAWETLNTTVKAFNEDIEARTAELKLVVEKYNAVVSSANAFLDQISIQIGTEFEGKSEKWQESDRGLAVSEWHEQWEGLIIDEVDIDMPLRIEIEENDYAEQLDALPVDVDDA